MSWQEGVAVTVVLLGLGAGAFLVAQRPSFWIEFGARLGKTLLPLAEITRGVVTPGGITEAGQKVLDEGGTWPQALDAVLRRISGRD